MVSCGNRNYKFLLNLSEFNEIIKTLITLFRKREAKRGLESGFGDIISKKFGIYYDDIVKPDKLVREFKELNLVALDLSCSASPMGHQKNRYANIYPYDKNRVILDIDAEGSDYINASFIDVRQLIHQFLNSVQINFSLFCY